MKDESKTFEDRAEDIPKYDCYSGYGGGRMKADKYGEYIREDDVYALAREADQRIAALSSTIEEAKDLIASLLVNEGYVFPNQQIPNRAKEFLGRTKK